MEEAMEAQHGQAMECSFRSSSSSSSTFLSFRSEDSLTVGYHPPMSEYEEIPSLRWLSGSLLPSKSNPCPPPGEGAAIKWRPTGHPELDLFQTHVADLLHSLISVDDGEGEHEHQTGRQRRPLVSLCFLRRLLEAFVCIEEEFKALLLVVLDRDPALVHRDPVGRLVGDLLDRAVRSLDICNAVAQALDSLHFCQRYAEIAAYALRPGTEAPAPPVREARFLRARRALSNLLAVLGPDQHCGPQSVTKERAWLFGRSRSDGAARNGDVGSGDPAASRSLSLNMSQNWSAVKQVEVMLASFAPPPGADATALSMAVYAMNAVMVLVVRTLVLAFPRQGQGGHDLSAMATGTMRPLAPPWQAPWAAPMVALQELIAEECRRARKGSPGARAPSPPGLLAELQSLARCGRAVVELGGGAPGFPLEDRQWEEVAYVGRELAATCRAMGGHLGPLRRQVREASHRLVLSRAEMLGCLSHP